MRNDHHRFTIHAAALFASCRITQGTDRIQQARPASFRAFLYGVSRNVALLSYPERINTLFELWKSESSRIEAGARKRTLVEQVF